MPTNLLLIPKSAKFIFSSPWIPISLAMLANILLTVQGLPIRYLNNKGFTPIQVAIDHIFFGNIPLFIWEIFFSILDTNIMLY